MNDLWTARWDERYKQNAYAYGEEPNIFLKEELSKINPGSILFAAEGEGRNAVYAATLGWDVSAFDISQEGKNKADKLAEKNLMKINYEVGDLFKLSYSPGQFDAIALIYAHFPPTIKSAFQQHLSKLLKKGGYVIFEAFSKNHLSYNSKNEAVGGPKDEASLFSKEELQSDFHDFEFILLEERVIELNEGLFHKGEGSVIRMIGRKK